MGMFQVRVRVSNPGDPAKSFEEAFWVDTGAIYTFIPDDRLRAIGIAPHSERVLRMADGREVPRPFGDALLAVEGIPGRGSCPVIFAPGDSHYLLGATALEYFGVDADPVAKRLKPILSIIGGFRGSAR